MATQTSEPLTGQRDPGTLWRGLRAGRGEKRRNSPLGYLFIAPAMILYLVFNIWPILRGLLMAFTDYRFIYPDTRWDWIGVDNFVEMWHDTASQDAFWLACKYFLMVVPATVILALVVAILISHVRRGSAFYRWVVYLPSILPVAVCFLMFREMYNDKFGLINANLRALGIANPPDWLNDAKMALPAIAAAHVWILFGFPTLLFLIGIYNISHEVYEAAALDGANRVQQAWYITVPLLKPTFALVAVLLLGVLGTTDPMLILTQGGPQNATHTIGFHLYQIAFQLGDLRLGYAAALSLVLGILSALVAALVFRWSRS
jgi:ABC-type sugar transport system permease subunit